MRLPVLILCLLLHTAQCARILGIFYVPGYSHFILGETLFKELARRGHEVTVINVFPQKEPVENYKDVVITSIVEAVANEKQDVSIMDFVNLPAIAAIVYILAMGPMMVDMSLQDKNVQELLHSNETFDVIILEQFLNEAHFGFMHHFKAPLILMGTTTSSLWSNTLMNNPTPYAYIPNLFLNLSPKMNFMERSWNAIITTFQDIYFRTFVFTQQEKLLHKYFPDAPPLNELMHNASLMFLNSHPALGSPVPLLPNMIPIGGFHVAGQNQQNLTDDLKKFLDNAKEGVVYFSMGSQLQSKSLDKEKRQHFLNAFAKLKVKVLWKFEDDDLPGKPANVRIEKWLPQPSVLAHENVKAFITHGGKLSLIESVYHGKPILGMPMFAEQYSNVQEAVYLGYGRYVSYQTVTENEFTETLKELLENPKYTQEAKYRSNMLENMQVSPLDNAVYWVEQVIKHKGLPHLQNPAKHLSWYEYLLLDVILAALVTIWILKKIASMLFSKLCGKSKTETQKQKTN